jgi:hypothetical protein
MLAADCIGSYPLKTAEGGAASFMELRREKSKARVVSPVTFDIQLSPPRCFDRCDVDLSHLHHCLEGTLCLSATSRKRVC